MVVGNLLEEIKAPLVGMALKGVLARFFLSVDRFGYFFPAKICFLYVSAINPRAVP